MDAFYASVEQRDDPALRRKPVIVARKGKRSLQTITTLFHESRSCCREILTKEAGFKIRLGQWR